tara:strand:- start:781 stop:1368 length:588 start_codon:yes stop_codon:yes gene_type:complete
MTKSGYLAYLKYLALQRHFTSNYDYHKFAGKVKASTDAYQKRNDMFSFEKITKIINAEDIEDFYVSHFITDPKCWIKNMNKSTFEEWTNKLRRMPQLFKEDLEYIKEVGPSKMLAASHDSIPLIHDKVLKGEINLESVVLLDRIHSYLEKHEKMVDLPFVWPDYIKKVKNYKPFLLNKLEYKYYEDIARDVLISS